MLGQRAGAAPPVPPSSVSVVDRDTMEDQGRLTPEPGLLLLTVCVAGVGEYRLSHLRPHNLQGKIGSWNSGVFFTVFWIIFCPKKHCTSESTLHTFTSKLYSHFIRIANYEGEIHIAQFFLSLLLYSDRLWNGCITTRGACTYLCIALKNVSYIMVKVISIFLVLLMMINALKSICLLWRDSFFTV